VTLSAGENKDKRTDPATITTEGIEFLPCPFTGGADRSANLSRLTGSRPFFRRPFDCPKLPFVAIAPRILSEVYKQGFGVLQKRNGTAPFIAAGVA